MARKKSFLFKFFWSLVGVLMLSGIITASVLYNRIYYPNVSLNTDKETFIDIPTGASFEMVLQLLSDQGIIDNPASFIWISERKRYNDLSVKSGRYLLKDGMSNNDLVNLLRSGRQTPISVVFNNLRTKEEFAGKIAQQLEIDSLELLQAMLDTAFLEESKLSPYTVSSLFIPNTYEFYWNTPVERFLSRMVAEHHHFWNDKRRAQAKALGLTLADVTTLASVVEKESFRKEEQATIAGLYLNRLKKNMRLQSDPTVIYALGDFSIRRVLKKDLKIDSPYNTYRNKGLPIGPICMPSIQAIESVLNAEVHNYLYMCAKADFSGFHSFAVKASEHYANAAKYRKALNERNIKR